MNAPAAINRRGRLSMLLIGLRTLTGYASIGIAVTLSGPLRTHAHACSKVYMMGVHGAGHVHFLGIARSDTIAAGPGDVKYRIEHGHFGRGRDRTIYGQLVDVEKLGRRRPGALRALGNTVRQAILVPWDYAADCNPFRGRRRRDGYRLTLGAFLKEFCETPPIGSTGFQRSMCIRRKPRRIRW